MLRYIEFRSESSYPSLILNTYLTVHSGPITDSVLLLGLDRILLLLRALAFAPSLDTHHFEHVFHGSDELDTSAMAERRPRGEGRGLDEAGKSKRKCPSIFDLLHLLLLA